MRVNSSASESHIAASAFVSAWKNVVDDYNGQKINSERCLQASIYFHLRTELHEAKYTIYVESTIYLPNGMNGGRPKSVDIVVTSTKDIVFAAELKYKPTGVLRPDGIAWDLEKLSFVKKRRSRSDQIGVMIKRYLASNKNQKKIYGVSKGCVVAFAAIAKEGIPKTQKAFWESYRTRFSEDSVWKDKKSFPSKRLLICAGLTSEARTTSILYGATAGGG